MDTVQHLLRRSRLHAFAVNAHRALPFFPTADDVDSLNDSESADLWKRQNITPEQLESMQSSARASAIRAAASEAAARQAATAATTTARVGTPVAQTTATHSAYVFSDKYATATSTAPAIRTTAVTTARTTSSAVASSVARSSSSSSSSSSSPLVSSASPSSSAARSSSSVIVAPSPSSTTTVRTITRELVTSTSSSSAATSAISAAANGNSSSNGMSTGGIAGIVVAVLVGIVVAGTAIGWAYRKHSKRKYASNRPWSKIDDDITPFPATEKYGRDDDDIYGASSAPVIGSRRALAQARQNNFNEDGTYRPESDYLMDPNGSNRAGVGSGGAYGPYPDMAEPYYGLDPHGRPYNPDMNRAPMPHMYAEYPVDTHALTAPGNSRHLAGPQGYSHPELAAHALGRPAAPTSNFAIAQHEDFADTPEPLTPTNVDYHHQPYTPQTATSMGEWAGDARPPQARSRVSMNTPQGMSGPLGAPISPVDYIRPPPAAATDAFPMPMPVPAVRSAHAAPSTLPSFEPMSPLMSDFDLRRESVQPLVMYEDERAEQKRLYGEVASTAGVPEPPTPKTAFGLNDSTNSTNSTGTYETTASFGAPEPMPRLPSFTINPPQPYIHGQPLSPLDEMPTPMSQRTSLTDAPVPSSSLDHGESNPYERTLLAARQLPAPPYSAVSSTGATAFPSPAYPPPSPGGMSVPASVTDSPSRYDTPRGPVGPGRRSMYDEEDAYGGI